jgi:hypothetical protein
MNAEKIIDNLLKVIGYVRPAGVAIIINQSAIPYLVG